MNADDLRVDGARLWASIEQMGSIGAVPGGGVSRLALTPEDVAARELLRTWLRDTGCDVQTDAVGNQFGRRAGASAQQRCVMLGSHLDTQPTGGRFDGALGVLAALEVFRTLTDSGVVTRAPLVLANWTDEEGARFDVSCVGSASYAGALGDEERRLLRDDEGVTFDDAVARAGVAGSVALGRPEADSYFELHIEQGTVLERAGLAIGVVEGIQAVRWIEVSFRGAETHAGTTPLDDRRDAALAAARLVVAIDGIARAHGNDARGAACQLAISPNAGSVVSGSSHVLADLRHPDDDAVDSMQSALESAAADIARAARLEHEIRPTWVQPRVRFDDSLVDLVETSAADIGVKTMRLVSGAGHDAGYVMRRVPSAMLFVPCRDGVSHNPSEYASPEHAELAANVLLHAVLRRAGRTSAPAGEEQPWT